MDRNLEQNKVAMSFIEDNIPYFKDFADPFFDQFGFNYFSYMRLYNDGKIFRLTTKKAWNSHFFYNEIYNDEETFQSKLCKLKNKESKNSFLIRNCSNSEKVERFFQFTRASNMFFRHVGHKDFVEVSCFGSDKSDLINYFLNQPNLFQTFLADLNKIVQDRSDFTDKRIFIETSTRSQELMKTRAQMIDTQCLLNPQFFECNVFLTPRQIQIVLASMHGETSKEAAKKLSIGYRTVETHWKAIQGKFLEKTGLFYSRSQIIETFLENAGKYLNTPKSSTLIYDIQSYRNSLRTLQNKHHDKRQKLYSGGNSEHKLQQQKCL